MVKYRNELKYICNEQDLAIIKSRLENFLSYDSYVTNGYYCIRSMYFDNYENRCFYENENGTDPREKFRIRIYDACDNRISLECKRKERDRTLKTSCLITKKQFDDILNGSNLDNFSEMPDVLRKFIFLIKTELFKPSVIVEYDRTPFVYSVGNVRITLDMNIRSSKSFGKFFEENIPTRQILQTGYHLLEVKYDEFLPGFIKDILQLDSLQRNAFSKYYLCKKYSIGG